jgi:hypothetical protein
MIYTIATKKGLGIELWGTEDELRHFHEVIAKFWGDDSYFNQKGFENRDALISSLSYEIRKAYEGSRLIRNSSHVSKEKTKHFGARISWVHILFSLSALRYNMRFIESIKQDLLVFQNLEESLRQAMYSFDKVGAELLEPYLDGGIYSGNEYLYQYMRTINADYFELGGGKKSFRMLSVVLSKAVLYSDDYNEYLQFLIKEAKRLKCDISDLEIDDDHIAYDNMEW